jgi:exosortase
MPVALGTATSADAVERHATFGALSGRGRLVLLFVLAELVVLYAPTVTWLVDRWTLSVWHNAHGMMIPPAVAYFAYHELRRRPELPIAASALGFLFLVPAVALLVLDLGIHSQIMSAVSLVLALPGLSLLFLGTARTRAIAFPLAFSVFMLPLPLAFTEPIHEVLQEMAAAATVAVLPVLGVSVYAEGITLHLSKGILIVGEACSGFSTLYAAFAVAALTAYSCDNRRGQVLALASAAPLAIAANVARIVLLAVLFRWQGAPVLESWMHPASGMLTFAISLPIIMWLGRPRGGRTS